MQICITGLPPPPRAQAWHANRAVSDAWYMIVLVCICNDHARVLTSVFTRRTHSTLPRISGKRVNESPRSPKLWRPVIRPGNKSIITVMAAISGRLNAPKRGIIAHEPAPTLPFSQTQGSLDAFSFTQAMHLCTNNQKLKFENAPPRDEDPNYSSISLIWALSPNLVACTRPLFERLK